jgi:hypothetical protein
LLEEVLGGRPYWGSRDINNRKNEDVAH